MTTKKNRLALTKKRLITPPDSIHGTDGQLMVMAAHRYCLGRRSYIVGACIDWLKTHWTKFEPNTQGVIVRDTIEALQDGLAGDDMDWHSWKAFGEWALMALDYERVEWLTDAVAHRQRGFWPLGQEEVVPSPCLYSRGSDYSDECMWTEDSGHKAWVAACGLSVDFSDIGCRPIKVCPKCGKKAVVE